MRELTTATEAVLIHGKTGQPIERVILLADTPYEVEPTDVPAGLCGKMCILVNGYRHEVAATAIL